MRIKYMLNGIKHAIRAFFMQDYANFLDNRHKNMILSIHELRERLFMLENTVNAINSDISDLKKKYKSEEQQ